MRRLDDLQCGGLMLVQDSQDYCFTTDAVLLANYFKAAPKDVVVELCSGSGVISILGTKKTKAAEFYCFELSSSLCDMCRESIKINSISNLHVYNADIAEAPNLLAGKKIDVVVANPPYFAAGNGVQVCPNPAIASATHEININLHKLVQVASKLLKFGGKFYMVYPSSRFAELCSELISASLQPKHVCFVSGAEGKQISLCLVTATKNGKVGLKIDNLAIAGAVKPIINN